MNTINVSENMVASGLVIHRAWGEGWEQVTFMRVGSLGINVTHMSTVHNKSSDSVAHCQINWEVRIPCLQDKNSDALKCITKVESN